MFCDKATEQIKPLWADSGPVHILFIFLVSYLLALQQDRDKPWILGNHEGPRDMEEEMQTADETMNGCKSQKPHLWRLLNTTNMAKQQLQIEIDT